MKSNSKQAIDLADRIFDVFCKGSMYAVKYGVDSLTNVRFAPVTYELALQNAKTALAFKTEAEAILSGGASHDDEMLLGIALHLLNEKIAEEKYFWNCFDYEPFFNMPLLHAGTLSAFPLSNAPYARAYVTLLSDFCALVRSLHDKAAAQKTRGILLAKPLCKLAAGAFGGFISDAAAGPFAVTAARTADADYDAAPYAAQATAIILRINEVSAAMRDLLLGDYYEAAPESIGCAQYPGGAEYYANCVRQRTTLDITPAEVFALGEEYRRDIEENMARIRSEQGYDCTRAAFTDIIMHDPAWVMKTPEEFGARLDACVAKVTPLMDEYFGIQIKTPCAAVRLLPELEPYYFNGIYEMANPPMTYRGEYRYNGLRMADKNPLKTESLGYHELMPGHHYQMAVVQESTDMHPLVKHNMCTAFCEGWAEYAAAFAGRIGLYSSPLSEYGRLEMDLYMTNYIVCDTSVNAMGWTLPQLEAFIAPYLPDYKDERLTNQLMRISQGMPGFSLAYKLGSVKMMEYQKEAAEKLGDRFDYREFHTRVLEWGAPPLTLLKKHLDWYINGKLEETV